MDTGYVNARVRGMYSILINRSRMDSLILRPDIDSLISELVTTPYKDDLERSLVTHAGLDAIEDALRGNMIRTFRKIHSFVEGETGERYIRIFLARWDLHNIKTILRGKKIQADTREIRDCLVLAGSLDEATIIELMKQPDVKSVINLLATWRNEWAVPLVRMMGAYHEQSDLMILEYALDQQYYASSLESVRGGSNDEKIVSDLIGTEIDLINIRSILTFFRDGIDMGRLVVLEGGRYLKGKLLASILAQETMPSLIRYLRETPYRFLDMPGEPEERVLISTYQNALDRYLFSTGVRMYRGDPLSITILIGYLWAKYVEVINLRIIARCKDLMVLPEDVGVELFDV